jgi:hypothetical protein
VPDMAEAHTFYNNEYYKGLTSRFIRDEIGLGLRERYQVPEDLPQKFLARVRRLDAVESNQSPRSRTLIGKLDAIEGNYLSRYAPPVDPRSVGPSDDWLLCT